MWMLPREAWGEYENAAPIDRLDLTAELARWTRRRAPPGSSSRETRRRVTAFAAAGRGDRRVRPTRRRRWSCCCTAAASHEQEIVALADHLPAGPAYAAVRAPDRRGRRLRVVRQPRHRPAGRGVAAGDDGLVPRLARRRSRPAGRPVVLVGFSGGAAFAGGLLLDDPRRYAGAAVLYGTLPFDAGVPTTPGAAGRRPGRRRAGRAGHRHPARAARPHLGLPARRVRRPDRRPPRPGRPRHRPRRARRPSAAGCTSACASSPAAGGPHAGPTTWPTLPGGSCPPRAGARPAVSPEIPQEQRSDNAPLELQEQVFARDRRAPRRDDPAVGDLRPGARGFMLAGPARPAGRVPRPVRRRVRPRPPRPRRLPAPRAADGAGDRRSSPRAGASRTRSPASASPRAWSCCSVRGTAPSWTPSSASSRPATPGRPGRSPDGPGPGRGRGLQTCTGIGVQAGCSTNSSLPPEPLSGGAQALDDLVDAVRASSTPGAEINGAIGDVALGDRWTDIG